MANADETATETDAYEVVTTEAVVPEEPDQDLKDTGEADQGQETTGDESANAQEKEKEKGQEGDDDGKEPGKDDADKKQPAEDAGEDRNKPKGRRYQKRIDRLTKRAAEAERRAKEAESKLQAKSETEPESQAQTQKEPDPASFDSYDDYLEAFTEWKAAKKAAKPDDQKPKQDKGNGEENQDAAKEAEKPTEDEDTEYTEALEDVQEAFTDSRTQYEDFDEVIGQEDLQITRDMVKAMADADDPGGIAYHLGKHKDEAARIAALSPMAQAKEIGKVEANLTAKSKEQPPGKKTTQAPDPIEPVKGADSSTKDPKDMSFDEYEATMNEKEFNRGRGFW